MNIYDPVDIRNADKEAINGLGIPGIVLMENAGRAAAMAIVCNFSCPERVIILIGPGNNGGDGCVVARHLSRLGSHVEVISAVSSEHFRGAAAINYEILAKMGIMFSVSSELDDTEIHERLRNSDIVIDALLGTGSQGAPRGEIKRLISLAAESRMIISLDIPSGINATTGEIYTPCIRADRTLTMLLPKTGLFTMPAAEYAGEVQVVDIGVEPDRVIKAKPSLVGISADIIADQLPDRPLDMHKGDRGCVLIFGGSECYRGAPILAARGALRAGAGIVVLVVPEEIAMMVPAYLPEVIIQPIHHISGKLKYDDYIRVLEKWKDRATSALIGPGLGRNGDISRLLPDMWNKWRKPLLVDGDALFWLGHFANELEKRDNTLLTPHEGEASRLLNIDVAEIHSKRLYYARRLAKRWGPSLLKGQRSLVDDGKNSAVILEGDPSLSIPGSGDVLSGVIGAFMSMGMDPFRAAITGTWLHGRAGTLRRSLSGPDGTLAGEIADQVPKLIMEVRQIVKKKTKN